LTVRKSRCILDKDIAAVDEVILADFYIHAGLLASEVDGSAHDNQKRYDAGQDRWLFDSAASERCGSRMRKS
jgi:very-short-patch-repair endonuclease